MFFVSLIPFVHFTVAKLFVEVLDSSQTVVYRCDANGADFGGEISSLISKNSSIGCLHKVRPALACSSVQVPTTNSSDCATNFALVQRGDCCFSQKTWHSQKAGFMAMIVANNEGEAPMMMGSGGSADLACTSIHNDLSINPSQCSQCSQSKTYLR
ncbi:unnamed protein product, partial [Mesorhabditis belari]|uniref:PA domain-containing protein n=1 Tax=Mesorhabditis belari TaxID=2138241 RepID=A0AAF3J8Z3_9BILA